MSKAAKTLELIGAYLVFNLKGNLTFRASFMLQVFSMVLNDTIWVLFWLIYFSRFPVVHGWHQSDALFLWGLTATAFGIMTVLFGNITNLGQIVASGELDIYMSNPKPVLLHLLISRQSTSAWGDVLFGGAVLLISTPHHGWAIIQTFIALLATSFILIGFAVSAQSLVFYTGGREGIGFQLVQSFVTIATYPAGIFRSLIVRAIIFGVIPAGFVSSLPSAIIDGVHPEIVEYALVVGLLEICLGRFLFYRGMKIYTSGNRFTVRS